MGMSSKVILAAIALVILSAGSFIAYNLKNKRVDASTLQASGPNCESKTMYCVKGIVKYKNGELMRGALVRIQFADGSVWDTNFVTDTEGKFNANYGLDRGGNIKFVVDSADINSRQVIIAKTLTKGLNNIILQANFNSSGATPKTPTATATTTATSSPIMLPGSATQTPTRTPVPLPGPSTTTPRTVSSTPTTGGVSF